jgi:LuxR family transcriptional regulator, maltose regulon positive regulatory protein
LAGPSRPGAFSGTAGEVSDVRFTSRELSILEHVAEGCTNVQIAEKLHISRYTVAQHVAKMLHRIGAVNRTDLVSRAHVAGILSPPA